MNGCLYIWELVTLWVRNIPVEGDKCKWIDERSYIWTATKDMNLWLIIAITLCTQLLKAVVKLRPEKKKFRSERDSSLDTGAVLYRLSYLAIWEMVTLWARNIPSILAMGTAWTHEDILFEKFLVYFHKFRNAISEERQTKQRQQARGHWQKRQVSW